MVSKIIKFLTADIWRIRVSTLSKRKSFLIKQLRVFVLALRGFDEDKCQLRASALTFYSLLSIVPVVAMAFGIAKGFGFEKLLEKQILERLPGQEEIITQVVGFARALLDNTRGDMVAGIGVAILFWTVIKVLGNVEKSFNDIWGIKKARSIGRKFADYLSIMLICPVLLIVSSSATVFVASQIKILIQKISLLGAVSPFIFSGLRLFPYAIIWLLFSFIYIFLPNTKVNLKSGILAGIAAGTIYQVVQWAYLTFQIGVAKYNAIYGSLAALPLFLVWLQISWLVVLFGAEISFAHQNVDTYEFEPDCLRVSYSFKRLVSLRITHLLIKNFSKNEPPLTASQISHTLEVPIRLVRQIIYELVESRIISEVKVQEDRDTAYQPARDTGNLNIKSVIDALEDRGVADIPIARTKEFEVLSESLEKFSEVAKNSSQNKLLKEI
ncbi:MAG: YihY/virulence factor BrkB family protein [Candidatus Omnitrophica bacterium]|nr:YihY/virulence factor BrkB family protein [Candidatus Omnitrophota bacterium]